MKKIKVQFIKDYAGYNKGDIKTINEASFNYLNSFGVIKIFKSPVNKMMHRKDAKTK